MRGSIDKADLILPDFFTIGTYLEDKIFYRNPCLIGGKMALYELSKYYPNYRDERLACFDILNFSVYTKDELISFASNILVDENNGRFRYLVIDTGFWVFSIKVLLPVGLVSVDYDSKRLFVPGFTKELVNKLPEFQEDFVIDNDYEERVRTVYRPLIKVIDLSQFYHAGTYDYRREPYFYEVRDRNLKMYEQQLISRKNSTFIPANMKRQKYACLRTFMETA